MTETTDALVCAGCKKAITDGDVWGNAEQPYHASCVGGGSNHGPFYWKTIRVNQTTIPIRLSPKAARFAAKACEVLAEQCAADPDPSPDTEMDGSYYAAIAASIREQALDELARVSQEMGGYE